MLSERAVLEMLSRQDLLMLVASHELAVSDRRVREQLVAVLRRLPLHENLSRLSAASLKALVREFELTPASRKKEALVEVVVTACAKQARPQAKKKATSRSPQAVMSKRTKAQAVTDKKTTKARGATGAVVVRGGKKTTPSSKTKLVPSPSAQAARPKTARMTKPLKSANKTDLSRHKVQNEAPKKPDVATSQAKQIARDDARGGQEERVLKGKAEKASAEEKTNEPKRHGQLSSWAEVALAAAARGQSAATMLKPVGPARHVHSNARKCAACGEKLSLRKCSVQACDHMLLADNRQKICAECRFERNTLSMTDFEEVLGEERTCPHCEKLWRKP